MLQGARSSPLRGPGAQAGSSGAPNARLPPSLLRAPPPTARLMAAALGPRHQQQKPGALLPRAWGGDRHP